MQAFCMDREPPKRGLYVKMAPFDFSYFADDPSTIDQAPIPIAVIDASSETIVYINETFSAILGRSSRELVGQRGSVLTHPADISSSAQKMQEFLESDATHTHIEKRYLRPDGSAVWVDVTFFRSSNPERRNFYIAVASSLADRKKKQDLLDTRTHDLDKTREAVINSMAILSEFRDRETGEHIIRTRLYFRLILDRIPYTLPFSRRAISLIATSAVLHDIGKVGIPDLILLKPGKLTREEFEIMKTHTTLGAHAIMRTQRTMEKDSLLMFAKEIAEFHHERWDGRGYPLGLAGDEIPLTARVMALADVYDALRSERPYKPAYTHEESLSIIREGAGTQFDPLLTGIFLANEREILRISSTEKDELEKEIDAYAEEAYA